MELVYGVASGVSLGPRLGGSIGHVADVLSVLEFWAGFYDLAGMSGFRCVGWVLCWCFVGFSGIMGNNLGGLFCCFFHFCEGGGGVRFLGVRYLGSGWGSVSGVTASRGSKGVLQSDLPLKCDMSTSSSVLLEVSGQECGLSLCYVTVWPVMIYFIGRKYSLEITALFQLFCYLK